MDPHCEEKFCCHSVDKLRMMGVDTISTNLMNSHSLNFVAGKVQEGWAYIYRSQSAITAAGEKVQHFYFQGNCNQIVPIVLQPGK
jgi:hypothetical protein